MDRTAIIVVTVCVILLFTWQPLLQKLYPNPPQAPQPTNAPPSQFTVQSNTPTVNSNEFPTQGLTTPSVRPPVIPNTESLAKIETPEAIYTFTNAGGLKEISLTTHKAKPCNGNSEDNDEVIRLNHEIELPFFALDGVDDSAFSIIANGNSVSMISTNQAGIRIAKEFTIGTNYLLHTKLSLTNTKTEPLMLNQRKLMLGTAMPLQTGGYPVWGVQWHNGDDIMEIDEAWFANRMLGCFPGTPRAYFMSLGQPVQWVGIHNRFFAMTTIPMEGAEGGQVYAHKTTHRLINEPHDESGRQYIHHTGILSSLQYEAQVLQPGTSLVQQFTTYAGPKEFRLLEAHAQTYQNSIDSIMGFDTPVFGFFAKLLLRSMNGLHSFGPGYAICIILITVIIKLLFWPLTKASTVSMKRMAAYQPQMAEIREQYKSDPQKMNKRMMEFMRENKINPMGGCLPILIQMPVFIGFFIMLRSAVELRGAQFLWACDLSQADTIAEVAGFPINPLPLIMGATMIIQARITPVSPTADPMQQKIMKYMPLMFIFFLYTFSSGLTLYWTVQNMLSILQTKLTKNIVVNTPVKGTPSPLAKPVKSKPKQKKKSRPKP